MPRFSDKDLMKKAHTLTEAWMWPHQEERSDASKEQARVLRQILFEEMKARTDEDFNPMEVRFIEELLGDCNPMGRVIQVMHCDVDEADIDTCLERSFNEMLYGPSDHMTSRQATPEQVAEARQKLTRMRGTMESFLEEGVNPLAFSHTKLLAH